MREGKVWGETTEFFRHAIASAHHLSIKKGGYCSVHRHAQKYNVFYVLSGRLKVSIWIDEESPDETILERGQKTAVAPGFKHQFEALTDCECIEVYHVILVGPDIIRESHGGMK